MANPVEFLDLRTKEKFTSRSYTTEINSKGMLIARTMAPSGTQTTKIIGKP